MFARIVYGPRSLYGKLFGRQIETALYLRDHEIVEVAEGFITIQVPLKYTKSYTLRHNQSK